jgi:endonuclease/exonuclease/phosphatase family metal-dependent hydrolase
MRESRILVAVFFLGLGACAEELAPAVDDYDPEPNARLVEAPAGAVRLRIMAGNLTTGNVQAYEDPGIRIFRALQPDVALIQEFNFKTNSDADIRSFVDQAFGPEFSYSRGAASDQIPNGVVSRYPILDTGEWHDTQVSNRGFQWARIDIPGSVDLFAVSVHLLTKAPAPRQAQGQELVDDLGAVPAGAYLVLGGDFNTADRAEPVIATLSSQFATGGPYPVDQNGNDRTNSSRLKPDDWVLASPELDAKAIPVEIGGNSFSNGFVADTRVYSPIADLAPALATDSGTTGMQHMGVVRDFALPAEVAATVTVTAPNGGESWTAGASQTITWTATGVDNLKVEVTLDGTTWQTIAASTPAAAGGLSWTVPATATQAARVRLSALPDGSPSDVSDAPFNIVVPSPGRVFINEMLANEPGADTRSEFVELVNAGDAPVDLGGWTLADAVKVRHVFAAGTVLGGHAALVVYGRTASTGSLSLTNSGDTITLASPDGTVDRVSYTSKLAAVDAVSMNRKPDGDPAGSFVLHTTLSSALSSPGTRVDGSSFAP